MSVPASELMNVWEFLSCLGSLWSQRGERAEMNLFWEVGIPHPFLYRKILYLNFKPAEVVHSEAHPRILMADDVNPLIVLLEKHVILSCLESES